MHLNTPLIGQLLSSLAGSQPREAGADAGADAGAATKEGSFSNLLSMFAAPAAKGDAVSGTPVIAPVSAPEGDVPADAEPVPTLPHPAIPGIAMPQAPATGKILPVTLPEALPEPALAAEGANSAVTAPIETGETDPAPAETPAPNPTEAVKPVKPALIAVAESVTFTLPLTLPVAKAPESGADGEDTPMQGQSMGKRAAIRPEGAAALALALPAQPVTAPTAEVGATAEDAAQPAQLRILPALRKDGQRDDAATSRQPAAVVAAKAEAAPREAPAITIQVAREANGTAQATTAAAPTQRAESRDAQPQAAVAPRAAAPASEFEMPVQRATGQAGQAAHAVTAQFSAPAEASLTSVSFARPAGSDAMQDLTQIVDRLVAAREALAPASAALAVKHAEFGEISLRFDQRQDGRISAEISAADPETHRAVASAVAAERSNAGDHAGTSSQQQQQSAGQQLRGALSERDGGGNQNEQRGDQSRQRGGRGPNGQAQQGSGQARDGVFA